MRKIFRRFSCERERFRLPFGKIAGPAHASCARCRPEAFAAEVFGECRQAGNAGDVEGRLGRVGRRAGQRKFGRGSQAGDSVRGGQRSAGAAYVARCSVRDCLRAARHVLSPACRRGMSSAAGGSGRRRVCPRRNRARNRERGQSRPRPSGNAGDAEGRPGRGQESRAENIRQGKFDW